MVRAVKDIDEGLLQFATPTEKRLVEEIRAAGSITGGGIRIGMGQAQASRMVQQLVARAAMRGYAPGHGWTHTVPDPHVVSGVSTLYGDDGSVKAQWVKTRLTESQNYECVKAFVESIAEEIGGKSRPSRPPKTASKDMLTVIPVGDPHIGMHSWRLETGEDFDLTIAANEMKAAVVMLMRKGPATDTCIIILLGDFFHTDNYDGTTARSGNRLDVDSRLPKVVALGSKLVVHLVDAAQAKHKNVIVRCVQGNHDTVTSMALSLILDAHYRNNKRVTVETSASPFWYYQFHKVLIGATHGDEAKPSDLGRIMAADVGKMWGATEFRYYYHGHFHTTLKTEQSGCVVEGFRTLAPPDAWTHKKGYRAGRDINSITYHKDFGEIERYRVDIAMVRA